MAPKIAPPAPKGQAPKKSRTKRKHENYLGEDVDSKDVQPSAKRASTNAELEKTMDELVQERRLHVQKEKEDLRVQQERLESRIKEEGGSRAAIRRRRDLLNQIAQIRSRVQDIDNEEKQRNFESRAEKYIAAYNWNLEQHRLQQEEQARRAEDITYQTAQRTNSRKGSNARKGASAAQPRASARTRNDGNSSKNKGSGGTLPGQQAQQRPHDLASRCEPSITSLAKPCDVPSGVLPPSQKLSTPVPVSVPASQPAVPGVPEAAPIDYRQANRLLIREFLSEFENRPAPMYLVQKHVCLSCGDPLLLAINISMLICKRCKYGYPHMDTTTASMAYGDEVELTQFSYKTQHHCDDWIKKFQAKSSKIVERKIIDVVMNWLWDNGHRDKTKITRAMCRLALKKMNLHRYYDHVMQIWCRITGNYPPCMTPEEEDIYRAMFAAIQVPFLKWKDKVEPGRHNFLSYGYVLYKFCQLLGWNQYLQYFSLLKGKDKLRRQDDMWRGICLELGWKFIESKREEVL